MERLQQSQDVEIHWRSFELRPKGAPPLDPQIRARIESSRPQLYAMAREQYGLELHSGPFGIDSRPALIGAKFAEAHGAGETYHRAVFTAYWQAAQNIEDHAVLAQIAESVGLDRAAFLAALQAPEFEAAVLQDIAQAQQFNLSGVPAMVFASKYLVMGAQPYTVLENVVARVETEDAA